MMMIMSMLWMSDETERDVEIWALVGDEMSVWLVADVAKCR